MDIRLIWNNIYLGNITGINFEKNLELQFWQTAMA